MQNIGEHLACLFAVWWVAHAHERFGSKAWVRGARVIMSMAKRGGTVESFGKVWIWSFR